VSSVFQVQRLCWSAWRHLGKPDTFPGTTKLTALQFVQGNQRANPSDEVLYPILPVTGIPKTGSVPTSATGPGSFDCDTFHALSELDHKFLDDLFRSQEGQQEGDSIPTANPKTELTINANTVERAELVVHNEMVKRGKLVTQPLRLGQFRPN
jgi:hypothetical protein